MVGSDSEFGGRRNLYLEHGADEVLDLFTAREEGIIPADYHVFWGFEDFRLYEYAKKRLVQLAAAEKPFALTLLTVDTHFPNGYECSKCQRQYSERYSNAYACASRQAYDFVAWAKTQPFFENTTIIITGDHPSMGSAYIKRVGVTTSSVRRLYNCFINPRAATDFAKKRDFLTLDIFPTTLAAIGCSIEGEQLGLGVNLFSGKPTLAEQFGLNHLNSEFRKHSSFYFRTFLRPQ